MKKLYDLGARLAKMPVFLFKSVCFYLFAFCCLVVLVSWVGLWYVMIVELPAHFFLLLLLLFV